MYSQKSKIRWNIITKYTTDAKNCKHRCNKIAIIHLITRVIAVSLIEK